MEGKGGIRNGERRKRRRSKNIEGRKVGEKEEGWTRGEEDRRGEED